VQASAQKPVLVALIVQVIFAGTNFVAVKLSNAELQPFWGATLRFTAAGLVFLSIVGFRRLQIPRGKALQGALVYGF
jgi:drug/metabolite transporter (DMT)-like permease